MLKDDRGNTAVIFALLLPVILLFFAVVLDLGNVLLIKRQLQATADAAALAGVDAFEFVTTSDLDNPVEITLNMAEVNKEIENVIAVYTDNYDFIERGIDVEATSWPIGNIQDNISVALGVELIGTFPTLLVGYFIEMQSEITLTVESNSEISIVWP